jgi:hypothetical protein
MASINAFLREKLPAISDSRIHVSPGIDVKKLNNSIKSLGYQGSPEAVVAVFDNTLLGSAKEGLLFTGERLFYKETFETPVSIGYDAISSVAYQRNPTGKGDKYDEAVVINQKSGSTITLKNLLELRYEVLANVLTSVVLDFSEYQEERQLIPIEEMSEPLKVAYAQALILQSLHGEGRIDDKALAEIVLLMTRIKLHSESRLQLRANISGADSIPSLAEVMAVIDKECPESQVKTVRVSLVKDLVNLYFASGVTSPNYFAFINAHRDILSVSDGELELVIMAIKNDYAMLHDDYTDDKMVEAVKLLSAKAVAVGTPLAAVYLSGSVIGLSAAGMTSGLAALGMGGILGLSSMATGIGVAVLIGVAAYAGVRKLTGGNKEIAFKRRELMLHEVIKQTQLGIHALIEDVNYISQRLNALIEKAGAQNDKIAKLAALLQQMVGAGGVLADRAESAQTSVARLRCPAVLDEQRLTVLTREPTKVALADFIHSFYECTVEANSDGSGETVEKLVLRKDRPVQDMEALAGAFDAIGYFVTGDIIAGNAADLAEKAKSKLMGLFSS